jgi:hypothetical protein
MAKKSKSALSKLASRILEGAKATQHEISLLAASVVNQGGRKKKKKAAKKKKAKAKKRK